MCGRVTAAMVACAILTALVPAAQAEHSQSAEHAGLLHTVVADSAMYCIPDTVSITYTVVNVSAETLVILFCELGHPQFNRVLNPEAELLWTDPMGGFPELWWGTLAPGEFYYLESHWDMRDYREFPYELISESGTYAVVGDLGACDPGFDFQVVLPIAITDGSTGAAELDGSWSVIKALFR